MTTLPDLVPPWSSIPLVNDDTRLFPEPTMTAVAAAVTEAVVSSPELTATIARGAARGKGVVCFVWDDGYPSWTDLANHADSLGQKHTFGVTTNRLDAPDGVATSEVQRLASSGHEIASHTCTHVSMVDSAVSVRVTEYDSSKSQLEAIVGAGKITTFVYPFGARNPTSDRELYTRYDRLIDFRRASVVPLAGREGVFLIPRANPNYAIMENLIRLAAKQPVVAILAGHNPGGLMLGGNPDPLTLQQAKDLMNLAASLGVPCVTTAEAFPGGSMVLDPSFEANNASIWYPSGGTAIPVATPDTGLSGNRVGRLVTTDTTARWFRQLFPVSPGRSYSVSGRVRLTSGGPLAAGTIKAQFVEPTATYAGPGQLDNASAAGPVMAATESIGSTAWTRFELSYIPTATCRFLEAQFVVAGQSGLTVDWDHIHFGPTELGSFG